MGDDSGDTGQAVLASLCMRMDELSEAVAEGLDEMRKLLLDVASGEVVAALWEELRDIRSSIEELRIASRVDQPGDDLAGLEGELRVVRAAVDEVIGRLDDGLVLADEIVAAPLSVPTELRDLLATLREDVTTGFDSLRGMPPTEGIPGVGAEGRSDHALDELRADLVALRRRIKVRAEGRVLSDEQLEQIAEAVAQRLAY